MKLNILISTINDGIYKVENILMPPHSEISYIISHQLTCEKDYSNSLSFLDREDISYVTMAGKGLSRNRNNGLKYADGDLLLICDDDVVLIEKHILQIPMIFERYNDADMIRFQVQTYSGKPYKTYRDEVYPIRRVTQLTNFSSIEMVIRHSFLEQHPVWFDERFGIASEYAVGEDFIFAADIFKGNGVIIHYPMDIIKHDDHGTGGKVSKDIIYGRGAVFARAFGHLSFVIDIYFALKHRKMYRDVFSIGQYVKLMFLGSYHFLRGGTH